jgi:hypothetical protein
VIYLVNLFFKHQQGARQADDADENPKRDGKPQMQLAENLSHLILLSFYNIIP